MESVSFYKFAAAIMQLLEPENYNYNSQFAGSSEEAVLNTAGKSLSESVESEAQTVEAVAEHLTNVIQQADSATVAAAVKTLEDSAVLETNLAATDSASNLATDLIKEVINDKADKTIKNIENTKAANESPAEVNTPVFAPNTNFWDYIPEIEDSQIKYADTVQYLYGYADRNSLFNFLNPEIDLSERQATWAVFTKYAGDEQSAKMENYHGLQKSVAKTNAQNSETRQVSRDDESRAAENRKQADARLRMIAEQRRLDEQIADNRKP